MHEIEKEYNLEKKLQKNVILEKIQDFEERLKIIIDDFIVNLYYGCITEFLLDELNKQ